MLECKIPKATISLLTVNSSNNQMLNSFSGVNLVSTFGPLGLLPHLHRLWELVASGSNILVYSQYPSIASQVVIGLASLISPINYTGDVMPYISSYDLDIHHFTEKALICKNASNKNDPNRNKQMLVGIQNSNLLPVFEDFSAVIFIGGGGGDFKLNKKNEDIITPAPVYSPPVAHNDHNNNNNNSSNNNNNNNNIDATLDSKYKAFYGHLEEDHSVKVTSLLDNNKKNLTLLSSAKSTSPLIKSFSHYYQWWCKDNETSYGDNKFCRSAFVLRNDLRKPAVSDYKIKKRFKKMKEMNFKDRVIIGNQLLRGCLQELTLTIFKSETSDVVTTNNNINTVVDNNNKNEIIPKIAVTTSSIKNKDHGLDMMDIIEWLLGIPVWIPDNVPTIIMWILIAVGVCLYFYLGLPLVALLVTVFIAPTPTHCPKKLERQLRTIIPMYILYPNKDKSSIKSKIITNKTPIDNPIISATNKENNLVINKSKKYNFSGVWKRFKSINYEEFVAVQGAGFIQRNMAANIPLTHTIIMVY
jgi:hypothetical protein